MARNSCQLGGDLGRRQDKIYTARRDRARRHAWVFRGILILGEADPAFRLDGLQSEGPISGGSGKDHPDRPILAVRSQRLKKIVDGHVLFARLSTLHQF